MTEQFDSLFHKRYVTGDGIIIERDKPFEPKMVLVSQAYEEVLAEYRAYVHDPEAELPLEIMEKLRLLGKIK